MKQKIALLLTLCLLISTAPAALAADKQVLNVGSIAAGEYYTVTLEGKKLTLDCRFGEQVEEYPSVTVSTAYWDEAHQYYAGNDIEKLDYGDKTQARELTVQWTLKPSEYPIHLKVDIFNRTGSGFGLLDVIFEYVDGTYRFQQSPVLEQNKTRSDGWANLDKVEIDPEVQAQSDEICAGRKTDMDKLVAIHNWVCENIYYDFELYYGIAADKDTSKSSDRYSALGTMKNRRSVCAGYAALTSALVSAQGIPCLTVSGFALGMSAPNDWEAALLKDTEKINHAWNEAWIDGRWVIVDTTWDAGGAYRDGKFEAGSTRYSYFDPSLEVFSTDHRIVTRGALPGKEPADWARDEIFEGMCALLYPSDVIRNYGKEISRQDFCVQMIVLVEAATGERIEDYLAQKGMTAEDVFPDTDDADVMAAYALGIVKGKTASGGQLRFDAYGKITRQEAAVMFTNCAKLLGVSAGKSAALTDGDLVAPWAAEAVTFVSSLSDGGQPVMGDTGGGAFAPQSPYTGEQAMVSALRLLHCATR